MQNFIWVCGLATTIVFTNLNAQTLSAETVVIETRLGTMKLKLYEETPLHKSNFINLVKHGFYDSLMFHRVINNFMIQGGDPLSKKALPGDSLGHGDIGYWVPAEFNRQLIHKKGRLCAARENDEINPEQASSGCQFYIVMGKVRTFEDLTKYEARINKNHYNNSAIRFRKSPRGRALEERLRQWKKTGNADSIKALSAQIESGIQEIHNAVPPYSFDNNQVTTYTTVGGTPHLDGTYTVFGEVVEGIEVIDKIAGVSTDKRDRPLEDIRMKVYIER